MRNFNLGMDYNMTNQSDPMASLLALSEPPASPLTPQTGMNPMPGLGDVVENPKPKKGQQTKKEVKQTTDQKQSETRNLYLQDDEFQNLANTISNLPQVKDMNRGVEDMENLMAMTAQQRPADDFWVKPLLALADSQTGSKLAQLS